MSIALILPGWGVSLSAKHHAGLSKCVSDRGYRQLHCQRFSPAVNCWTKVKNGGFKKKVVKQKIE